MRIEIKGQYIIGYVDFNGDGETQVISLNIDFGEVSVVQSVCLPTQYEKAKLLLNCYNETFSAAAKEIA